MEHVTLTDLQRLVRLEGGKTDPRVVEHLLSGCSKCRKLIRREVIDSGRISPVKSEWHASDRELEILIDNLPAVPIEVLSHLRDGCPYCAERADALFRERTAKGSGDESAESPRSLMWLRVPAPTVLN